MPLAHILAPQIAQSAKELEADLGHAPVGTGYLNAGYEKTPYDPKGLINKPESQSYDPRTPVGSYLNGIGILQRSPNKVDQQMGRALAEGLDYPDRLRKGEVDTLIPNAPSPTPVQAAPPKKSGKKYLISLPKTGPAGYDESGQAVDINGRKLGYLNQPAIVTPYGDVPMRTGQRTPNDVLLDQRDPFARSVIEQKFGKHLKELEFNNGKFPPGYFKKMTAEEKAGIQKGVQALQAIRREEERGGPMI